MARHVSWGRGSPCRAGRRPRRVPTDVQSRFAARLRLHHAARQGV